jgi:lipooligosaccharide transport system permease protein
MHVQKTWEAIVNAPMTLDDVLLGELAWAVTKALVAGVCMLAVIALFGHANPRSRSPRSRRGADRPCFRRRRPVRKRGPPAAYDFFSYYMTLVLTPMMMLSGVFFPLDQLPHAVQVIAMVLPLYHGVEIVRPLLLGTLPAHVLLHVAVLAATR